MTMRSIGHLDPTTKYKRGWLCPAMLLAGVILLTIFEGALRKWVFESNPILRYGTYFSKDILFIIAGYVGFRRGASADLSWFVPCALLILLPSLVPTLLTLNPVAMILSLRAYLVLPACAFMAAGLVDGFRDVERCAILVAISAIIVALLGVYQYSLPANHFLNRYDASDESLHIVAFSGHVRATGTFAYISGMSMMAGCSAWAGTVLALPLNGRSLRVRLLGLGAICAGFVCSATSMSRGALLFWGATIIGSCLLYFRPKQVLAVLLACVLIGPFMSGDGTEDASDGGPLSDSLTAGLAYRFEHADSFVDRALYIYNNLYWGVTRHPFGEGLGRGQPGGAYAAGSQTTGLGYESEWGRIAFEIGGLGLAAVLFMRFATIRICWQQFKSAANDQSRLVLATALPFFGIISLGWMVFNHTGNSFAWATIALTIGMVLREKSRVSPVYASTFVKTLQPNINGLACGNPLNVYSIRNSHSLTQGVEPEAFTTQK